MPLVFCTAHVTLAEFFKPEPNPLTGQDGLFQLFFQNAGVQGFFPGFQLVQPLLGGRGQDALFNGFQKICQPLLCVPELVFQEDRQPGVLLLLGFHDQIYQPIDDFIAENHLNGGVHTNRSSGSLRMAFRSQCALPWRLALPLIVIVGVSHVAGAAFAAHQGAALAQNSLVVGKIAHILFCRPTMGDPVLLKRCCARLNKSSSRWRECRPVSRCLYSGTRLCSGGSGRSGRSCSFFTNGFPVRVRRPRSFRDAAIFSAGSPSAYRLKISCTMGAVSRSIWYSLSSANGEAQRNHTAVIPAGHFRAHRAPLRELGGIVFRHADQHTLTIMPSGPCDGFHADTRWTPFFSSWCLQFTAS